MDTNILIVDDEKEIADLVEVYLRNEGYTVYKYYNGADALSCIHATRLDLAILDVMLPDTDGFAICRQIRQQHHFPVIMLTAKVEDIDKITGLTIGADDYMTKPFHPLELMARVKAQLRRYIRYHARDAQEEKSNGEAHEYEFSGLIINKNTHKCMLNGKLLTLTPIEFSILWYMCKNRGKVVSSEELFEAVWGDRYLDNNNTVMAHIGRLREKMKEPPRHPKFIKTVWGLATRLNNFDFKAFKNKLLMRLFGQFILAVAFYTIALILFILLISYIGHNWFVWYDARNPIYIMLNAMDENRYLVLMLVWVIGVLLILLGYWRKTIGYVERMADAIDRLFSPDVELVDLPGELKVVEDGLNHIKYGMIRNEQLAKEAEQRKNDLVVYLAHDLKTPLTSVIGYLTLLRDEEQIAEPLREKYLSISLAKAERLEELINEFFEITRFNLKNLTLEAARINLTRMLEQMADEFKPLLSAKRLTCAVTAQPDMFVKADAKKLERVFDNLIRNAIHYSYDNSEIQIIASMDEQGVTLSFRNRGDMIPEAKLNHVFEQFYRLDTARSTGNGGAGLGLAIAKEIVELHGGSITASSRQDTIMFDIFLPALP